MQNLQVSLGLGRMMCLLNAWAPSNLDVCGVSPATMAGRKHSVDGCQVQFKHRQLLHKHSKNEHQQ